MKLVSINIGYNATLEHPRRSETTGIFKKPISSPVRIGKLGLEGDFIASKKHHGGPDQAVYVYGFTDYTWWINELGRELAPGTFGENLTISDLQSASFSIGDRLAIGEVTLEVTAARIPCKTFARRMDDPRFIQRFRDAERPGLYCRVLQEGSVRVGDEVSIEPYPGETLMLIETFRLFYESNLSAETLQRLLKAPIAERSRKSWEKQLVN